MFFAIQLVLVGWLGRISISGALLRNNKSLNKIPRILSSGRRLNMYKQFQNIQEEEGPSFSREDVDKLSQFVIKPTDVFDKIVSSNASIVLVGEGSHGTQECYDFRAATTKKLIESGLCSGVMIEGDFPDTAELHYYVTGMGDGTTLDRCLENFERFPSWMWGNTCMRDFASWLRAWNMQRPPHQRCGIFGLDLYSLHLSIDKVLEYLTVHDPEMCTQVRRDYSCFDRLEPQTYGMLVERGLIKGCEKACVDALQKIAAKTETYKKNDPQNGLIAIDSAFFNEMNARVVVDAEKYYRAMFSSENSWNLRDTHFFDTMERVIRHLKVSRGGAGRVVLWAHNSHLGDARYTHLDQPLVPRKVKNPPKDLNIGQLVKEKYPLDSITVGQLFNTGRVCCADDWGEPHLFKPITPALANSHENVLHAVAKRTGQEAFALDLSVPDVRGVFKEPRLQRAIGVIYRPQTERWSHYYFCDIAKQFDLVVFFETTSPVLPLVEEEVKSEEAETYPSGL